MKTRWNRKGIVQLINENGIYEELKEMNELLNISFQKVFINESMFKAPQRELSMIGMWKIEANRKEIQEMIVKLEEKRATSADELSEHILKECSQQ